MENLFKKLDCPPLQINGIGNHVHVLFTLSKNITLAKVMESVKSVSSKWIKTKSDHYIGFAWQRGYGAFSVSTKNNVPFNEQYLFDTP